MRKRLSAVLVAAAGLLATAGAQAQAPSPPAERCLRLGQIDGFSPIKGNDRAFIVTDRFHRRFKISLMFDCGGLDYNFAVRFRTLQNSPLACISRGDTVISPDPARAGARCPISRVELYTPAMEAADKAAAAAKTR